jgi:hypothetical protein
VSGRPVRLTAAEWRALIAAVSEAVTGWQDQVELGGSEGNRYRLMVEAADRALDKVRDGLTTPAVRR